MTRLALDHGQQITESTRVRGVGAAVCSLHVCKIIPIRLAVEIRGTVGWCVGVLEQAEVQVGVARN